MGWISNDGTADISTFKSPQGESRAPSRTPSILAPIPDNAPLQTQFAVPTPVRVGPRPHVLGNSSLRVETRLSDEDMTTAKPTLAFLGSPYSDPKLQRGKMRPYSHPASKSKERSHLDSPLPAFSPIERDPWRVTSPPPSRRLTSSSHDELLPKPRASLKRLSSLDHILTYRDELAQWKRAPNILQQRSSLTPSMEDNSAQQSQTYESADQHASGDDGVSANSEGESEKQPSDSHLQHPASSPPSEIEDETRHRVFRHPAMEYGFVITLALMQLLNEYLISGFAMELPNLLDGHLTSEAGAMGMFWPAVLLTLIMGSTTLFFARVSDICGGYPCYMGGVAWLFIWTLVPSFSTSLVVLDVSRAMQGLAIAAYQPSTFALIGSCYPIGRKRNVVLGIVAGCAPLGFFAGFMVAGALPETKTRWYWWTASILSFVMFWVAFMSVPKEKTSRSEKQLHMDWIGTFLIIAGLILLAFALSVEPYANSSWTARIGFSFPRCYAPLAAGIACLLVAFWYEGWKAQSPLLPFDFFTPRAVKPLVVICLFFYAGYGVWLYISAEFFQSRTGVSKPASSGNAVSGIEMALWYLPTAIGGIVLCVSSSAMLHVVHPRMILLVSAVAWIGAPLLLALAPLPLNYWGFVLPSMLCATIGLDLTYTLTLIYLSSCHPMTYQGLSGAMASSLINLGMSFALPIAQIAMKKARDAVKVPAGDTFAEYDSINLGFRAAFFYGVASAAIGLIIAPFVRIHRSRVSKRPSDEERPQAAMSDLTLVDEERVESARGSQHHIECT